MLNTQVGSNVPFLLLSPSPPLKNKHRKSLLQTFSPRTCEIALIFTVLSWESTCKNRSKCLRILVLRTAYMNQRKFLKLELCDWYSPTLPGHRVKSRAFLLISSVEASWRGKIISILTIPEFYYQIRKQTDILVEETSVV